MREPPKFELSGDTYYLILGVRETATLPEIKQAYRALMRQVHPDKFPNASPYWKLAVERKSKQVIESYYVLLDPTRRSVYDQQLTQYRQRCAPVSQPEATTSTTPAATSLPNPRSPLQQGQSGSVRYLRVFVGFLALVTLLKGCDGCGMQHEEEESPPQFEEQFLINGRPTTPQVFSRRLPIISSLSAFMFTDHTPLLLAASLGRIGGKSNRHASGENADSVPTLNTAIAVQDMTARLIADVLAGRMSPRTAACLTPLLSLQLRAIDSMAIAKLERRFDKLENPSAVEEDPLDLETRPLETPDGDFPILKV